ncbi:UDP binding domain-containing protein [Roseibium salinum]|nr:UDP binding domain-containing protein [Roseibium salinum]
MIKYTSNAWRALKITFANEIGNIAKASGLDGQEVMRVLCSDGKVAMSPAFLRPGFAFGGSCLPKDVRALRCLASELGVGSPVLDAVLQANAAQIERAEQMVRDSGKQRIGFVGVSFKAGTDDLRESPLAALAARLIEAGGEVRVYDPFVAKALSNGNGGIGRGNGDGPDLRGCMIPSIDELIDQSDVLLIGNRYAEATEALKAAAAERPVIDLARLDANLVSNGTYQGICW